MPVLAIYQSSYKYSCLWCVNIYSGLSLFLACVYCVAGLGDCFGVACKPNSQQANTRLKQAGVFLEHLLITRPAAELIFTDKQWDFSDFSSHQRRTNVSLRYNVDLVVMLVRIERDCQVEHGSQKKTSPFNHRWQWRSSEHSFKSRGCFRVSACDSVLLCIIIIFLSIIVLFYYSSSYHLQGSYRSWDFWNIIE